MSTRRTPIGLIIALAALALASVAQALPTNVTVTPPRGARLLERQRFDIRVEGQGTGPFAATLQVDGEPVAFTSGRQNTVETDGISSAGWGGFNVRGHSFARPGLHTLSATFTDSSGSVTATSTVLVVGLGGGTAKEGVKNVVIFLGDGMGVSHRTAARIVKYGVTGGDPNGRLEMEQLPGLGLVSTHSLSSIITDSAPGMACYTTGNHANNNQEGVYPAHVVSPFAQPRVEYLGEYLHRLKGTSLGIVTTADVEDATPAANAVHTGNRNAGTGICDQYLDEVASSGLSVLMGGGRRWFLPNTELGSSRAASTDYAGLPTDVLTGWKLPAAAAGVSDPGRDLRLEFQQAGFTYVEDATALRSVAASPPRKLLGLFGYGNMNVALDKIAKRRGTPLADGTYVVDHYRAPNQPMLDEMTTAALSVLSQNRKGFVLMVEGAHIDKQSHLMDADRVIGETLEFDAAVGVARRWAESHHDTLIVVLADHECSGFSVIGALTGGVANARSLPSDAAVLDPTKVPARQALAGTYDAAGFPRYALQADGYPATMDVDGKVVVGYGASGDRFETWLSKPLPVVDSLLPDSLKSELKARGYGNEPLQRVSDAAGFYLRGQVSGGQAVHTAGDIPLAAGSPGSDAWRDFGGVQTNTDVFFKLARALLGGDTSQESPRR
jgi:alkaline phosphatase